MSATLLEKVKRNFEEVRLNKIIVKVPKIRIKQKQLKKPIAPKKEEKTPLSALVRILIKNALENAKKQRNAARQSANIKYRILEGENDAPGGYGSVSRIYGISPAKSYVDYEKLFSYLGQFRAKGSYYSDQHTKALSSVIESKSFELVSREALDKGARYVKYFFPKAADFHLNLTSLVPVAGMNSADWEQFKLMMILDPVMYALKSKSA
ncbi:hypothetical protein HY637_05260 [Candidatus Woesearchaeota archaeon]|nr:hypothetical protein [Candidatus Woesearchaeota archaeon]